MTCEQAMEIYRRGSPEDDYLQITTAAERVAAIKHCYYCPTCKATVDEDARRVGPPDLEDRLRITAILINDFSNPEV